ncbi:uncharacterized protein LOC122663142 [Telopea speciosissima]|uniref:uncharacterized protein LOC122663142 n=1 Tax=Telopea speciosissima TaxID=54955 RepID=UPI001CC641EB|nr:uncharacterized protein LOC122663142 [Telopea speciosissima]
MGDLFMAAPPAAPPSVLAPLYKQRSWSADTYRDEAWLKRKGNHKRKRSKSVTNDDLDDLKACIELGFGFDSPDLDRKLSNTLPALSLYHAVNKQYSDSILKSLPSTPSSETSSPPGSPLTFISPGDDPQLVKTRLRQWAQVVACSVRQSSLISSGEPTWSSTDSLNGLNKE